MNTRAFLRASLALAALGATLSASATLTLYGSRDAWLSSFAAGSTTLEDFSADAPDLTGGVDFNGFNLRSFGGGAFFNRALNGVLEGLVDGSTGTRVVLTPSVPAYGFGAEFETYSVVAGIALSLDYADGGSEWVDFVEGPGFRGFASTRAVRSFTFTYAHEDWFGDRYEGFDADDYRIATTKAVPEPASMAALGLGAVAMLRRRKKA